MDYRKGRYDDNTVLLSRYTITWMIEKEMNETLLVNATYLHCEKKAKVPKY